jgi:hypothetical protein
VEARLVPVNALIGLVTRDGLNPAALTDAGLELVGLEIPCVTSEGVVVIDTVLANPATDPEFITPHVRASLVAALAQHMPTISITSLTEQAAPHYVLYTVTTQGRLRRRVGQAAKEVAASAATTFEYCPPQGNHDAFVKFLHSPEQNDPRGRTQGYQGLARTAQRPRRRRPEIPGQGSLLDELEKADSNEESALLEEEEGDET